MPTQKSPRRTKPQSPSPPGLQLSSLISALGDLTPSMTPAQRTQLFSALLASSTREEREAWERLIGLHPSEPRRYTALDLLADLDRCKPSDRVSLGQGASPIIGALGMQRSMLLRLGAARPFHIPSVARLRSWVTGELRASTEQDVYIALGTMFKCRVTGLRREEGGLLILETDR